VEDVDKLLAEIKDPNCPQDQAKVDDLAKLKDFILEKNLTNHILEGPEPEPFW
jgi:hypothetical protein